MSFLCRVGIHSWVSVGFASLVMPTTLHQCKRCGIGRAWHFYYTETFTAEQMTEALTTDRARLRERIGQAPWGDGDA